jgi:iron only hydrogenase large subunit-like protein
MTERFMPNLSPMIATALAVKEWYGPDVRCVFIGPCVAKKAEILDEEVAGLVDEVLTFEELRSILTSRRIDPSTSPESDFDPPHAGTARVYPIPGGLFKSAGIGEGILDPRLVVVSGHSETLETLSRLPEDGDDGVPLLVEALMCKGCYDGPGVKSEEHGVLRRRRVAQFASESLQRQREGSLAPYDGTPTHLALRRSFTPDDQRTPEPTEQEIREIMAHTTKVLPEDELNAEPVGTHLPGEGGGRWAGDGEENMCLPFIIGAVGACVC